MLCGVLEMDTALSWALATTGLLLVVGGTLFELEETFRKFKAEQKVKNYYTRKMLLNLDSKAIREDEVVAVDHFHSPSLMVRGVRDAYRFKRIPDPQPDTESNPWCASFIAAAAQNGAVKETLEIMKDLAARNYDLELKQPVQGNDGQKNEQKSFYRRCPEHLWTNQAKEKREGSEDHGRD